MMENRKPESEREISLPFASLENLRGKQSVRATFKLSEECIDAIAIVATQLGIKQKSLFDHLIDDMESLRIIAGELQDTNLNKKSRIQKTYVVSRKTLSSLEAVSRNYNAPRDALVEYSVQRLAPIIAKERQKHENRKKVLDAITKHLRQGEEILSKAKKSLGEDDPVYDRLESIINTYDNAYESIRSFLERGKIIEAFDIESMKQL
jgi:hypothetical protein